MKARFESLGAYLPPKKMSMKDRIAQMQNTPSFDLQHITGIQEIRVADGVNEDSFTMALAAAKDALSRSKYKAEELDCIIIGSITRFINGEQRQLMFEPALSHSIKFALGAPQAMHFDVSNACAGMFTGVLLLERMIKAGTIKNGMVISGEFITTIAETAVREIEESTDPQFGSMTVGDSAAAVILDQSVSEQDCIHYYELMSCADYARLCLGMPSDKTQGVALYTVNAEMHKKDRIQLWPRFQMAYYKEHGSSVEEEKFDHILHHQVGTRAIHNFSKYGAEVFEAKLPESTLSAVEYLGNTATTAHFITLYENIKSGKVKKGDKVLIVPAASGVITGFLSVTISNLGV